MNKLIVVRKDVHNIDNWSSGKDFQEYYDNFTPPLKDVEIFVEDINLKMKCYCKGIYVNIYLSIDGGNCGNFRMRIKDKYIIKSTAKSLQGEIVSRETLKDLGGFYRCVMAYIAHYRKAITAKESKEITYTHKKSIRKKVEHTYVFNSNADSEYKGGHHASPSYSFTVRGHFRHLKNGKRIWIKEYIKGKEKPVERSYRL